MELSTPRRLTVEKRPISMMRLRAKIGRILGLAPGRMWCQLLLIHEEGDELVDRHLEIYFSMIDVARWPWFLPRMEQMIDAIAEAMERNEIRTTWMYYRHSPVDTEGWMVNVDPHEVLDVVCWSHNFGC